MPRGTLRFWAAARAAAGVNEEAYDAATLAEALAEARAAHGDALSRVLDRCSFVVDDAPVGGRAHDSVLLTDGGTVEVLPPFAGGSSDVEPAADATADEALPVRESVAVRRTPGAKLVGVGGGLVAAGLAGMSLVGIGPLTGAVFAVQVVLALAWLAAIDLPGGGGAFVLCLLAAGTVDGLVGTASAPDIGRGAGVLGAGVAVCLLYQLARRPRVDVTRSLAGTLAGFVFVLSVAAYPALLVEVDGDLAVAAALFGTGAALAAGRVIDALVPRPAVVRGSRRGVAGAAVGLAVAVLVGWAYGAGHDSLGTDVAVRLAGVTALIAVIADIAVDAVLCADPPADDRARSALPPLGLLLPVALAAPAAYVAGRILLG